MQKQKNELNAKSGFTLIEIILVVFLMVMFMAATINSSISSTKSLMFTNSYGRTLALVRLARSYAVTGKAMTDYTDYNKNGSIIDAVTPVNFGVFFNIVPSPTKINPSQVILFADLHGSTNEGKYDAPVSSVIGTYEAGKDIILERFSFDPTIMIYSTPVTTKTILFSPIFADASFDAGLAASTYFLNFDISEASPGTRKRCFRINIIAGVPEDVTCTP